MSARGRRSRLSRAAQFSLRLLCAFTWHSWKPILVEARVLCECSFCGSRRWISVSCFDVRR